MLRAIALAFCLMPLAGAAHAWDRVGSAEALIDALDGRRLTHLLYNLSITVTGDGAIRGDALGWDVSGTWTWEDGNFCRSLFWGGDDLGYNCQLVERRGTEMRFTSDRGAGRSASFRLRD